MMVSLPAPAMTMFTPPFAVMVSLPPPASFNVSTKRLLTTPLATDNALIHYRPAPYCYIEVIVTMSFPAPVMTVLVPLAIVTRSTSPTEKL